MPQLLRHQETLTALSYASIVLSFQSLLTMEKLDLWLISLVN